MINERPPNHFGQSVAGARVGRDLNQTHIHKSGVPIIAFLILAGVFGLLVIAWFLSRALSSAPTTKEPHPKSLPSDGSQAVAIESVEYLRGAAVHDYSWLFPRKESLTSAELADLNKTQFASVEQTRWMLSHGAIAPNTLFNRIIIKGNAESGVRITGMRTVGQCVRPAGGTFFNFGGQDEESSTMLAFNLDDPMQEALEGDFTSSDMLPFFATKTIRLDYGEEHVLQIAAHTDKHYCAFYYVLDLLVGGKRTQYQISDGGAPFKVSAIIGSEENEDRSYSSEYVGGGLGQPWVRRDG
jgi:hypothetical protein